MSLQIYGYYLNGARKMGENFEKQYIFKLLPLQGILLIVSVSRVLPWATSFWAFSPFLNHLQCSILKKKSQYPADGAEYCDFTFSLYKSFLFDAFFYRLQYIVENLIGVAEGDEIALKLRWTYVDAHRHAV